MAKTARTRTDGAESGVAVPADDRGLSVEHVPVARIRPEEGLGRKRDRDGHRELQKSIERFGVLTPITVRLAPDGSGDYLLIKGQGRTLACRLLGVATIPALVVDPHYAQSEKVQQFLVENVARLKMRPVDRALLVHRARKGGEETAAIAKRFGLAPATVRRLLGQLEGASSGEVAVMSGGKINLAAHAVVIRAVDQADRASVLDIVSRTSISSKDLEVLFAALGWERLVRLGTSHRGQCLRLFEWACRTLAAQKGGSTKERLRRLALAFPVEFAGDELVAESGEAR